MSRSLYLKTKLSSLSNHLVRRQVGAVFGASASLGRQQQERQRIFRPALATLSALARTGGVYDRAEIEAATYRTFLEEGRKSNGIKAASPSDLTDDFEEEEAINSYLERYRRGQLDSTLTSDASRDIALVSALPLAIKCLDDQTIAKHLKIFTRKSDDEMLEDLFSVRETILLPREISDDCWHWSEELGTARGLFRAAAMGAVAWKSIPDGWIQRSKSAEESVALAISAMRNPQDGNYFVDLARSRFGQAKAEDGGGKATLKW